MNDLNRKMIIKELDLALEKLSWYKAPERNRVAPNSLKALNKENWYIILLFIYA